MFLNCAVSSLSDCSNFKASDFTSWQTCSFWNQLDFTRKHSAILKSLHNYFIPYFLHCLTRYSYIWLNIDRTKLPKLQNDKDRIRTQAISIGSLEFYGWATMLQYGDSNVLARHALWRYDNAFLQNENAIFSFQITLFSMSNNCLFGVMYNWVLQCQNWLCLA